MTDDAARHALARISRVGADDATPADLKLACQLLGISETSDLLQARDALSSQNKWLTNVIFAIVKLKQASETEVDIRDGFIHLTSKIEHVSPFVEKNLRSSIAQ